MKNVLLLLHDDEGQEARLQVALDVTRALSGHLTCLDVLVPPEFLTDYFTGAGGAMVMEYVRGRESDNRSAIEARLRAEGVAWSMHEARGSPDEELKRASDLADIIVVSGPGKPADLDARHIVGEVAVKSGRPLLVVPPSCRGLDVSGSVLVAWNGSHEASEALRSAVPLLKHAASVTLLDVNPPAGDFSVSDAAAYLSRHGIHAGIVKQSTKGPVSDAILANARATGASYVVIGAFGLPRAVEAIFGGVTAGVLLQSELPLLLAH